MEETALQLLGILLLSPTGGVCRKLIVCEYFNHGNIKALADASFGLSLVVSLAVLGYHSLRWKSFKTCHYRLKGYNNLEASFYHERMND